MAEGTKARRHEGTKGEMVEIPFGRPMIGPAEREAVMSVLDGPILTHGPRVGQFEAAFEQATGAPHAVAVSSCTAALHLAWLSAGLGPGDEVIVPALTHVATAHAVELCGARCVFVDAEPASGNIDLDQLESAITPATRGISVVHFLGRPVDMERVAAIAARRRLIVIEDCALALGATFQGRHVGLWGDAGAFSFYPAKHLTTAEGGMLVTRHDDLAADASCQRAFGIDQNVVSRRRTPGSYDVLRLGHNYRMNELSAALGLAQLGRLDEFLSRRRANDAALASGLAEIDEVDTLPPAGDARSADACYCRSVVLREPLAARRDRVIEVLGELGVGVSVYYPRPVPALSWYLERYNLSSRNADKRFPVAARLCAGSIALPVGPHLDDGDMSYIVEALKEAIVTSR